MRALIMWSGACADYRRWVLIINTTTRAHPTIDPPAPWARPHQNSKKSTMVQCDECAEWYHLSCIHLSAKVTLVLRSTAASPPGDPRFLTLNLTVIATLSPHDLFDRWTSGAQGAQEAAALLSDVPAPAWLAVRTGAPSAAHGEAQVPTHVRIFK